MAPPLIRFAVRRVLFGLVTVWFASSLAFVLVLAAPGGPAMALGGTDGAPGQLEELDRSFGLDRPVPELYAGWLARWARGDFGDSYRSQVPVSSLIAERAPVTVAVMLPALVLAVLAGLPIGLRAADGRRGSGAIVAILAGLHAVPSYVLAQTLVVVFALGLGWFPVQGVVDPRVESAGVERIADIAWRLTLPVLSLATLQLAFVALLTRARVAEELREPYMLTALAKGLSRPVARRRHALPNAALPLLTLIGWRFGAIVGGTVVIETVFALPGLGRLAVTSALARDIPTVVGLVALACTVTVVVNIVVDLLAYRIDPRLSAGPT